MPKDNESRLEEAFACALALSTEKRPAYLDDFCGTDLVLREELNGLLHNHRDDFLPTPALELPAVREALLATPLDPDRHIGPYKLLGELGRGGMAIVYRGERADGSFEKQVAIKVLSGFHSAASDEARFRQEWRILGQLDTPNIAKIIDAGSENGVAYFVMEYVDGSHIDIYCREHNLSIPEKLRLFLQVCQAVSLAHNSKIVHRDLKPANILVDKTGTPRLIDFGIAKVLDAGTEEALTVQGLELMTLLYASPEQLSGSPDADLPSSDIYSLGVVLYQLLTGRRPIEIPQGTSAAAAPRAILETQPMRPSFHDTRLAGDLDTVILKSLRKERLERYSSVEQLASYIRLYLENRPLPEGPPGIRYKATKFLKRNRNSVVFAALLLITLVGGIAATMLQARVAQRRFGEVRQLATSFLFEFDAAIANVKGATEARRLVVAKGLEYLDKLSRDSGRDKALRVELASAYERLAGIQGNVYGSNLGEYEKAAASYEKALGIWQALVREHPEDRQLLRGLGLSRLQLADGWFTRGNGKNAIAQYREGIEILSKLSQAGDRSVEVQGGLQRGHARLCNFLLSIGDHKNALSNCETAIRFSQELVSLQPANRAQRAALAAAYGQTANALRIDKRVTEAIPMLERSASEFQKLLSDDPTNNGFSRNLAGAYTILGLSWDAIDQHSKAILNYEKSIALVRGMIAVDAADIRPKATLAVSLIRLGAVLIKSGRPQEAKAAASEGLALFRDFADRPNASADDLNNYSSFLNEVSVPELREPRIALAYSKRAVARVREPSLVFLSTLADAYHGVGDLENAIRTGQKALDSNPLPKGNAEVGVRADFERKIQSFRGELDKKQNGMLRKETPVDSAKSVK